MPWFAAQGLLLSGQFLHTFLASASPSDLQRFMPGTTPAELQFLRVLVDLFPVCGAIAAAVSLIGSIAPLCYRLLTSLLLALSGIVPLITWAIGRTRLPAGSTSELGLWLIGAASAVVLTGGGCELLWRGMVSHA